MTSRNKAKLIAELAYDKKAEDIVILDMRRAVNFCDYFVVMSGASERHVQAIAAGIEEGLLECGLQVRYKEGLKSSRWVLVDMGDVVTHIFELQTREFYGLEHLWQEAGRINWKKKSRPKSSQVSNHL